MFLRPQEIPRYVEQGLFDLGITGRDWVTETDSDVASVCELEYSKATSNPVRIILAVPKEHPAQSGRELPDGVRVSTEYPELTRRFFAEAGVRAVIVPSYGATEAKVPDIVDAIVDVTETGSSLRAHGLRILETLLVSRTELVANKESYADPERRAAIRARGTVLLKLNVGASELDAVLDVLPSMASPTVTQLASGDMRAVESVVGKRGVNTLIPALKAAGARDILELPITKIVE
jgi:ATP phosphoribosyltransferase